MSETEQGVAFHVHHSVLAEVCISRAERLASVRANKPASKAPVYERLLQIIPPSLLPAKVQAADAAWKKAYAAWNKADAVWNKADAAWNKAWDKADAARKKADAAWNKADAAWNKAWDKADAARKKADAVLAAHAGVMEVLHKRLCPNCPWDGKSIFPKEASA